MNVIEGTANYDRSERIAAIRIAGHAGRIYLRSADPIGSNEPARFLEAYRSNQSSAHELALDSSPVSATVVRLMEARNEWSGTPTELLAALTGLLSEREAKAREWPKAANKLTNELRKLAPDLRRARGLDVDCDGKDANKNRMVTIARREPDKAGKPSSPPEQPTNESPLGDDGNGENPDVSGPDNSAGLPQPTKKRFRSKPNRGVPGHSEGGAS